MRLACLIGLFVVGATPALADPPKPEPIIIELDPPAPPTTLREAIALIHRRAADVVILRELARRDDHWPSSIWCDNARPARRY